MTFLTIDGIYNTDSIFFLFFAQVQNAHVFHAKKGENGGVFLFVYFYHIYFEKLLLNRSLI